MKYVQKMKLVPYDTVAPVVNYVTRLDQEMSKILESKIANGQKLALYQQALLQYKNVYNPDEIIGSNFLQKVMKDFKNEKNVVDSDVKVKLEKIEADQLNSNIKQEKSMAGLLENNNKLQLDLLTLKNTNEQEFRNLNNTLNPTGNDTFLNRTMFKPGNLFPEANQTNDNTLDNSYAFEEDFVDDKMNDAFDKTNPSETRASKKEYENLRKKAIANNTIVMKHNSAIKPKKLQTPLYTPVHSQYSNINDRNNKTITEHL